MKITRSGERVVVTVVEAPLLGKLQFEGSKTVKDADLEKATQLKPGSAVTKVAVQSDVARVAELYRHGGRYTVEIKPKTIAHGDGRVDLVLEINEGAKTGVKRIAFIGNRAFSASRLQAIITTTRSGWFAFLKTSDVYDPDRVEADRELIRRFYAKNGYADARCVRGRHLLMQRKRASCSASPSRRAALPAGRDRCASHVQRSTRLAEGVGADRFRRYLRRRGRGEAVNDLVLRPAARLSFVTVRAHTHRNAAQDHRSHLRAR